MSVSDGKSAWGSKLLQCASANRENLRFLTTVSSLEGELRTDQSELLRDFRLDDTQALHLRLYTDNLDTPAVHLLAGKGSGRQGSCAALTDTRL